MANQFVTQNTIDESIVKYFVSNIKVKPFSTIPKLYIEKLLLIKIIMFVLITNYLPTNCRFIRKDIA